jgi:hypothetical protein
MGKRKLEKKKRKKRLEKQITGLQSQKEKHTIKLETEKPQKDTTPKYWEGEIEDFENQKQIKEEKLKKLEKQQ